MSTLQISAQEVEACANQLRAMEQEVSEVFSQIQNRMNALSGIWNSPASQSLLAQFDALRPAFSQYTAHLENYASFLSATAIAYEENEAMLAKGAV